MQLVTKSGIPGWAGRWYDLRRSFCCDLLESGIDVAGYEYMADHGYTVGKRHYQIMHKGRELRAIGTANALFSRFVSAVEAPKNHSQDFSQNIAKISAKSGIAYDSEILQDNAETVIKCEDTRKKVPLATKRKRDYGRYRTRTYDRFNLTRVECKLGAFRLKTNPIRG